VAGLPARLLRGGPRPLPGPRRGAGSPCPGRSEAVLLDRDGTVLIDIPYNGDPELAVPVPGAKAALARLREANLPLAVVSNQSGIARGTIGVAQVRAVNQRADRMLGPIDEWLFCPHGPDEGCECRKPAPGMIIEAAERLGVRPERCAVVGDIAADVQAAQAAGAIAILVPTERTEAEDVRRAPLVASSLAAAVDLLLGAEANAGATLPLEAAA
jgi:histidinol-phosphate phosphatase family protein